MLDLNDDNCLLVAASYYNKDLSKSIDDFYYDYKRIVIIKRLIGQYKNSGQLNERLLLNHLITFYNVFGIKCANSLLWYKINKEDWSIIKPFLIFLNYIKDDEFEGILLDQIVVNKLRQI